MLTDDPIRDEERRQAEWDAKCAAAPHCNCCGGSVYPHDTFVETSNNLIFCEKCFNIFYVDDLEV